MIGTEFMKMPALLLRSPVSFIVLLFFILSGCSSTDAEMRAFVGQPSSQLLAQLGTPKLRAPDGHGGEIWSYLDESEGMSPALSGPGYQGSAGGFGTGPSAQRPASVAHFTVRREFLIDSHGVVYQYRHRGH